jgi:hypothetical protein
MYTGDETAARPTRVDQMKVGVLARRSRSGDQAAFKTAKTRL